MGLILINGSLLRSISISRKDAEAQRGHLAKPAKSAKNDSRRDAETQRIIH